MAAESNPKANEDVMIWYCLTTFSLSVLCFVLKFLMLRDSATRRLSKAAEFVRPVEVMAWVFAWYGVSVSMVMANRWLFGTWLGVGFPFPTLVTAVHMWLKFFLTRIVFFFKSDKPSRLDPSVTLWIVIPVGVLTAGDILLSNLSFKYVTVTFYTIAKSGSLIWILLWAAAFKFEPLTLKTLGVVSAMCGGLLLASWRNTEFSMVGLIMIMGASCVSGLRWSLVQLLQSVEPSCDDPLLVIYYIAPSCAIPMTLMSLVDIVDIVDIMNDDLKGAVLNIQTAELTAVIVGVGLFSFALIFAEVKLLAMTSSLTIGVFGTVKEVVQIGMAVVGFHEHITVYKVSGMALAMFGSSLYKIFREPPSTQSSGNEEDKSGQMRRRPNETASRAPGKHHPGGAQMSYSAVSQQEVDEELRVFKYSSTEWELEGELEEFS